MAKNHEQGFEDERHPTPTMVKLSRGEVAETVRCRREAQLQMRLQDLSMLSCLGTCKECAIECEAVIAGESAEVKLAKCGGKQEKRGELSGTVKDAQGHTAWTISGSYMGSVCTALCCPCCIHETGHCLSMHDQLPAALSERAAHGVLGPSTKAVRGACLSLPVPY